MKKEIPYWGQYRGKSVWRQIADGDIPPFDADHGVTQHGMAVARKISNKCEQDPIFLADFMVGTSVALETNDQRPATVSYQPVPEWIQVMMLLVETKVIPDKKYSYEDLWDGITIAWEYQADLLRAEFEK